MAKRMNKLSGDAKKDLFWSSIHSQSLSDLRGTLTATGIEAHTRHDDTGRTALMEAALKGKVKSLDCLLDWYERRRELRSKGWIDLRDDDNGRTPLMLAAQEGHDECVRSLIRYGAKLELKDEHGKSALDLAIANKKSAAVEVLEETLRPPEEDNSAVADDGSGMTSTQKSKLKKKELKAVEGSSSKQTQEAAPSGPVKTDRDKSIEPSWEEVAKVCESFDMLRAIHEINVAKPDAEQVDPALWNCHWLKLVRLRLSPKFSSLPGDSLAKLGDLQQLILSGNPGLVSLPPQLGQLSRLRNLELEGCGLTSLPDTFGQLVGLESLNVSNNKLKELRLDGCVSLSLLNVSGNSLKELSLPFGELTRLSELRCNRNQIGVLPAEMSQLISLTIFEAEENKINEIPVEMTQLKKIRSIKLAGNPIADPKIARLVKDNKSPKDIFSKLEKVEERSAGKKKGGKKSAGKKKDDSEEEEEEEEDGAKPSAAAAAQGGESSDLDIDDDEL